MPKEQIIMLKAITDESRLRIIKLLEQGEQCACVLLENLHFSQPTLSHDMKVLVESGLIIDRRDGKNIFYSLNPEALKEFHTIMGEIFKNKLHCVCDGHGSHERKAAEQP